MPCWIVLWGVPMSAATSLKPGNLPAVVSLTVAVLLAYANAFFGNFQFDDYNVVVDNPAAHGFGVWWQEMPGIRPLLKLSYVANWTSGFGTAGFHAVNVFVHAVNVLLVFFVVQRLIPHLHMSAATACTTAFFVALLFALHPAQTEAVTYISGRSVSLMASFALASLFAWLVAMDTVRPQAARGMLIFSALLFMAALMAKENAWILPAVLFLCAIVREDFSRRIFFFRSILHWLVLSGLSAAVLLIPDYGKLLSGSLQTRSLTDNLLTQIDGVFYLITGPLFGFTLNIDPDLPAHQAWSFELAMKCFALIGLLVMAGWQWRRRRWISFGIFWFFVWLLPTNSILPRVDVANDRQLYLAMMGPALTVAVMLSLWLTPKYSRMAIAVLVLVLGSATILRNQDYRTEVALWESTVKHSPNKARAWNNLGHARRQAGDDGGAKQAWQQALAIAPDNWRAKNNLDDLVANPSCPGFACAVYTAQPCGSCSAAPE